MIDLIYSVLYFAGLDVILTNYLFTLMKRKDCLDMRQELNWLPRKIINGNPTVFKAIIMSLFNMTMLSIVYLLMPSDTDKLIFACVSLGALVIINIYHVANYQSMVKNWNNEPFWKLQREKFKVML